MNEITKQKFLDWFDELESYSFRSERFYEALNAFVSKEDLEDSIRQWLEAAFEAGFKSGAKSAMDGYEDWVDTVPGEKELDDPDKKFDVKYQISLLKDYPRVQATVESLWGTKRGRDYIHGLAIDDREGRHHSKVKGFPQEIYNLIAHILLLHDKFFPQHKPPTQPWDVFDE